MPLEYVTSVRGRLKLVYDGYMFFKDKPSGVKTLWRCEWSKPNSRFTCTARLHTLNEEVITVLNDHNHPRDQKRVSISRALSYLKMNALMDSEENVKQLINDLAEERVNSADGNGDGTGEKLFPSRNALLKIVRRLRAAAAADCGNGTVSGYGSSADAAFLASCQLRSGGGSQQQNSAQQKFSDDVGFDTENEESSLADNEHYVSFEDKNEMNNAVTNLYKGSNDQQSAADNTAEKNDNDVTVITEKALESVRIQTKKRKIESFADKFAPAKKFTPSFTRNKDILLVEPSSVKFSDVGGCETQLLEICKLVMHLKHPEVYKRLGVKPPRGFLLHGPPGCGKTLLAYAIAGELDLPFLKVAAPEIVSGVSGDSEQKIRDLFNNATAFAPCILFLDEIDAIAPRRETAQREMERRIVAQLLSCLDDLERSDKRVMIIGTTSRPDSIDPALRRAGRFDKEIGLGMPDEKSRQKILEIICRDMRLEPDFDMRFLSRLTPGYVGADLSALAREASVFAINRVFFKLYGRDATSEANFDLDEAIRWLKEKPPVKYDRLTELYIKMGDFMKAVKTVTPSSKREGFATVPDVTWEDVGALANVRDDLKWSILYPIKHPEAFDAYGLSGRPQGILLCGPPGCGKTLIAKAVANESGMNFISVKGPELLSMYVGESERAVRQVFQRALNSSPCVIFFDELDALCPTRSDHESGGTARVVNQLLTEMDGIEGRKYVFIIGATNRPDIIDPAILRPGRLDKVLYVGFPSIEDKVDILRAVTKNRTKPPISDDCDFGSIAGDKRAEFFTGADLSALVHEAAVAALKENMQISSSSSIDTLSSFRGGGASASRMYNSNSSATLRSKPNAIARRHFETAFNKVQPSVGQKEREHFLKLRQKYERR